MITATTRQAKSLGLKEHQKKSSWMNRLAGMSISERWSGSGDHETILVGRLPDQTALSSVLNTLHELHLPVVSADCLEKG